MTQDWTIQTRSVVCTATQAPFAAGDIFHTLLFQDQLVLRREDLSDSAYKSRPSEAPVPFSHWRSKFEPTPAKAPEPLGKQSAEQLLRTYIADPDPKLANVRYILAVMLERKRIIKEVETSRNEEGKLLRIYNFPKTGEVLVIPDPQLRLDQIAEIQMEVAGLLGGPASAVPAPDQSVDAASLISTQAEAASEVREPISALDPIEQTNGQA